MRDLLERLLHQLIGRVAGECADGGVHLQPFALGGNQRHADGRVLEGQGKPHLAQAQRLLILFFLRDVARDFDETPQLPLLVANSRDDQVRPEPRAVLAYAPAFLLVAPGPARLSQHFRRMAPGHVLRRIKTGKMFPDNLAGLVTLDPLGPCIPADDDSLRVQRKQGVILHRIDHEAKLLLARAHGLRLARFSRCLSTRTSTHEGDDRRCPRKPILSVA